MKNDIFLAFSVKVDMTGGVGFLNRNGIEKGFTELVIKK